MKVKSIFILLLLCAISCVRNPYPGIDPNAIKVDENHDYCLFILHEDTTCYPCISSLWIYDKENGEAKMVTRSTGPVYYSWQQDYTVSKRGPKDSIESIYDARLIMCCQKHPWQLVAEGCCDHIHKWSYIITEGSDTAIMLPTTDGYLGRSMHEDILFFQSSDYYGQGGTYSILQVFDLQGNKKNEFKVNKEEDIPFDEYMRLDSLNRLNNNIKLIQK